MRDCLIIGHNDMTFETVEEMHRSMGKNHPSYKDLMLNFINYKGKPYRALDILSHFYFEDKKDICYPLHNGDLLWMVIAYLSTYISRRGFTFDYINLFQLEKDRLREMLENSEYLTIVITTTIYSYDNPLIEIMSFIRKYNATAKIIVGGPYISKKYCSMEPKNLKSIFKLIDADFYIYSTEGEQTLVNLLGVIKSKDDPDKVNNIAYKKGRDYIITSPARETIALETNMVDYTLFKKEDFRETINLRVSEGCPYACSFCSYPKRTEEKYKYMAVDHIESELNFIRDTGAVTNLFFIDGSLNVPKTRFKEMLRMMIKQKYNFKWHCFFRCDKGNYDEETVELMKEAGCEGVFIGLESANENLLRNMNKRVRKEDNRRAFKLFKKAGIIVFASLFVGFPGETVDTFQETMDFLQETKPDFYRPLLWYCDPVTPIWDQREKYGLKGYSLGWSHNTMDVKTACDLVQRAFLSIDEPIWVPDPGFNFVSLYYLKRRGMPIEKVKTFLKCFNTIVREKLLYPNKKEFSPGLIENLRISSQYDKPGEPDMMALEVYSGSKYIDAERFWLQEFGNQGPSSTRETLGETVDAGDDKRDRRDSPPAVIEQSVADRLQSAYDVGLSNIILAAYSILLLGLRGQTGVNIVTVVDEKNVLPIRLNPLYSLSFKEFVQTIPPKVQSALEHRLYAFHILTNPLRMAEYGSSCPAFEVAYWTAEEPGQDIRLEERFTDYPQVYQGIGLALKVIKNKYNHEVKLQFRYSTSTYGQETIEKLNSYLIFILKKVCENRDILLKEIVSEPGKMKKKVNVAVHANKGFNF